MQFYSLFATLLVIYSSIMTVLAETASCEVSCKALSHVQTCAESDLSCICDAQVLADILECAKCTDDPATETSTASAMISLVCKDVPIVAPRGLVHSRHFSREIPRENSTVEIDYTPSINATSAAAPSNLGRRFEILGAVAGLSLLSVASLL